VRCARRRRDGSRGRRGSSSRHSAGRRGHRAAARVRRHKIRRRATTSGRQAVSVPAAAPVHSPTNCWRARGRPAFARGRWRSQAKPCSRRHCGPAPRRRTASTPSVAAQPPSQAPRGDLVGEAGVSNPQVGRRQQQLIGRLDR
jgi:hypothetical protein